MFFLMDAEIASGCKKPIAIFTFKGFLSGVGPEMYSQIALLPEMFTAVQAFVVALSIML